MKFTQIPTDTFKNLQMNAGIIVDSFTPSTGVIGDLLGATSGGNSFSAKPTFEDFGSDIDNCPKNTKELKKLTEWEAKLSGTFVTVTPEMAAKLLSAADETSGKITPRADLATSDFDDLWLIGDYSEINEDGAAAGHAGYCAIHLMNGLSTGGFVMKTADKKKGTFAFEFTAHYSLSAQSTVPFEIYVQAGSTT